MLSGCSYFQLVSVDSYDYAVITGGNELGGRRIEMNQILLAANDLLKDSGFTYAVCGGFALDLFTNTDIRMHSDIDICVFERDKNAIFRHVVKINGMCMNFKGRVLFV